MKKVTVEVSARHIHLSDKDFVIMLREGFEFWKDKAMIEEQKGT